MDRYETVLKRYGYVEDWENTTFGDVLEKISKKFSEKIAIIDCEKKITYKNFRDRAQELAQGFYNMGIRKGDNIAVQLPNGVDFLYTCFALFYLGAIPVLILPAHRELEIEGIFRLAKPVAYIFPKTHLGYEYSILASFVREKFPEIQFFISTEFSEKYTYIDNIKGSGQIFEKPSGNDIALLLLSGGTTGVPKLIPRTHVDYIYNANMAGKRCPLNTNSVYLAVLPVAHNFPLSCPGALGTIMFGGTVVMSKTTSPDEVFPLISEHKVTVTALVPALISLYMEALEWEEADLSTLQVVQVGGGKLEHSLAKKIIEEMPFRLQQNYGTAEGLNCATLESETEEKLCYVQGKPISEFDEIRIVDDNGHEVPDGEYGHMLTRGPYTIWEYYKAPAANQESFTEDGFYKTGDKVRKFPDGNIEVAGRIEEQINRAGEKIIPAEVENYLCKHPEIKEAVVIPVADQELGNKSFAFLKADRKLSYIEVREFLSSMGISKYKIPDEIEMIQTWPLTNFGKIDRNILKKQAEKN